MIAEDFYTASISIPIIQTDPGNKPPPSTVDTGLHSAIL
jgi:hypothetical protein